MTSCRICGGTVQEFFDFGRQPVSDAFIDPNGGNTEFFYRLTVGHCTTCSMVQQLKEVPRDRMFPGDYPYRSSGSAVMRKHFAATADRFLATELVGEDPFYVEIGCNDGILLGAISRAGVRHLGVDPAESAVEVAREQGCRVRSCFFEEATGAEIRAAEGPAQLIFSANTISHIGYIESIFAGADALLAPGGAFVFEDRYLGDIVEHAYFDQIYDEHFYLFGVRSVQNMAQRFGFELVDVEHLPVHGGAMRYTTARAGERAPTPAVAEWLASEEKQRLAEPEVYTEFGARVEANCRALVELLTSLRAEGRSVVGYGATSKSATVTNYCGIGPDLIPFICDSTREKQGRLTPGARIPILPPDAFSDPYPDYALLFAWNHAEEVMAKEQAFREAGGRWILYVPDVHIV
ncbi:class I SAM-dependent methyltransferase [Streptomyces yanii]|uniref:Methyltransferase domain-containing protein n=1 Tax=Streptomyces yanii TaxID=78510 RepID=A0ABV5R4I5_9ACTN